MNYLFHILVMLSVYSILCQSLNLSMGYAGLPSLCHAAFYGLGAYASTILVVKGNCPFVLSLLAAVAFVAAVGFVVSFPVTRCRGDFFVLATLAFQMIVFVILHNWTGVTGGAYGIAGIPKPSVFGFSFSSTASFAVLSGLLATLVGFIVFRLTHSPFGRTLQALREDDTAALALGKHTTRFRRTAFTISAALAAIAGTLFACYSTYIDATIFSADEAIFIFAALVIGGAGSFAGPTVGSLVLVLLPEALRFLRISDAIAANTRQVLFGLLLILLMRFRPQGIAGKHAFD